MQSDETVILLTVAALMVLGGLLITLWGCWL